MSDTSRDAALHDLAHSRQFLLGPRPDSRLASWSRWELQSGLVLQTHPNLACAQQSRNGRCLTLIGFAFTPDRPGQSDADILASLLAEAPTLEAVLAASDGLSGRWILIHEDGDRSVLFQDATGQRTAVHALPSCGETWCASQPELIARKLGLAADPEALQFWTASGTKIPKHIRAWPGTSTAFADVHALLPNHYLDLGSREAVRFFPREPLQAVSLEDGTRLICEHLQASLRAAHARYEIHQQITAGLDSRCILAASRECSADTTYFTCVWPSLEPAMTAAHRDVEVPRNLLGGLGVEHRTYPCPEDPLDRAFALAFATCDSPPLDELASASHALSGLVPDDALVINGNGGEIGRCRLHPIEHPSAVDLGALCNMHWPGLGQLRFVKEHLGAWQRGATAACARTGYRLLDLFYWEQKMSRRVARGSLHLDMAHETFSPYNSRALLRLYLGVPEEYRRPGTGHVLQHAVIRGMWPETLAEDINPATLGDRTTRLLRRLRRRARGIGLPV